MGSFLFFFKYARENRTGELIGRIRLNRACFGSWHEQLELCRNFIERNFGVEALNTGPRKRKKNSDEITSADRITVDGVSWRLERHSALRWMRRPVKVSRDVVEASRGQLLTVYAVHEQMWIPNRLRCQSRWRRAENGPLPPFEWRPSFADGKSIENTLPWPRAPDCYSNSICCSQTTELPQWNRHLRWLKVHFIYVGCHCFHWASSRSARLFGNCWMIPKWSRDTIRFQPLLIIQSILPAFH